jgi:Fuc2NAc and GlcNAc transferase
MIGTANFFNFMDGIDGIAASAGRSPRPHGIYALNRGPQDAFQAPLSLLAVCISLACLGYLPFNLLRAKVFMGDVGSILLGFIFACLVVTLSRDYLEMVCLAGLLFPFYADELTTMAVRLRDRENLTQSHRRHLYQLLVNQFGVAHWKVTLLYGAVQFVVGALVLIAYPYGPWSVLIFLTVCLAGFTGLASHVRNRGSICSLHRVDPS